MNPPIYAASPRTLRTIAFSLLTACATTTPRETLDGFCGGASIVIKTTFFKPTHIKHIVDLVPDDLLALSPGSRFLVDTLTDYKDVWFDKSLLDYPDTE